MSDEKDVKIVECNFKFKCPQKWEEMQDTGLADTRFCGECKEMVYFAETAQRVRELRDAGKCVAVWEKKPENDFPTRTAGVIMPPDFPELKSPNGAQCENCGALHSTDARFCARCGSWRTKLGLFIKKIFK